MHWEDRSQFYDGRFIRIHDGRLLRRLHSIHLCLRETLTMENLCVGIVAISLVIYLFASLIRPEKF